MSEIPEVLALQGEDVRKMLACQVHFGSRNIQPLMQRYVYKRKEDDGIHIIDLRKTWQKLCLASRIIVPITLETPADIGVVSIASSNQTSFANRAILKFCQYTGATPLVGIFTPGTLTNPNQKNYKELRLIITTDTIRDHQAILEASYVNCPVISLADTDNDTMGVDCVIPCNNKGKFGLALIFWMLTREILRMRGEVPRDSDWDVMVDMFLHKDAEELEKQEQDQAAQAGYDGFEGGMYEGGYDEQAAGGDWTPENDNDQADFTAEGAGEQEGWDGAAEEGWQGAEGGDAAAEEDQSWMQNDQPADWNQ